MKSSPIVSTTAITDSAIKAIPKSASTCITYNLGLSFFLILGMLKKREIQTIIRAKPTTIPI
jgi:hypothetical protein